MQKKYIVLFGGVLLVILLLVFFKVVFDKNTSAPLGQDAEMSAIPPSTQTPSLLDTQPAKTLLNIKTNKGDVLIKDPRKLADTTKMGTGMYSLTTLENVNSVTFDVVFSEDNGSFAIGLEKEPIAQARLDAEKYLQQQLGISVDDICSLNIFVGVPYTVNNFYSGQNLGISFCPGSVSLE